MGSGNQKKKKRKIGWSKGGRSRIELKSNQKQRVHNNASAPFTLKSLVLAPNVLIVGDGDFSFSRAVCQIRAEYLVSDNGQLICSSFDSGKQVIDKYPAAQSHLVHIKRSYKQVVVRHGLDATKLAANLKSRFDRIIFNFPHTGRQRVHLNRAMLGDFFVSACSVLNDTGVVLVTVKDRPPYSLWDLAELAKPAGLVLKAKLPFIESEFPGYVHQTTDPNANDLKLKSSSIQTYVFGRC